MLTVGPYRLATAICFEDTVPQVVQRFFRGPGAAPDVLLNLSNDGWFARLFENGTQVGSSEHDMHLAISVFRTIEHRIPLARAANTGISAIVDGNGRVRASVPSTKEDVLIGVLPLDDRTALYSAWGDWLGQGCLAVSIGWVFLACLRSRRGRSLPA
jgi:apolipoprotein N-acyltransferase